mmetsp:Transcript_103702/g.163760  ORF Transcript_103702/g.163760 Transcript_103702/m.163760 type:complete len:122 (+) Transcript_103702:392-757(+)
MLGKKQVCFGKLYLKMKERHSARDLAQKWPRTRRQLLWRAKRNQRRRKLQIPGTAIMFSLCRSQEFVASGARKLGKSISATQAKNDNMCSVVAHPLMVQMGALRALMEPHSHDVVTRTDLN